MPRLFKVSTVVIVCIAVVSVMVAVINYSYEHQVTQKIELACFNYNANGIDGKTVAQGERYLRLV